ncbi:MAG TPA: hypothetical protein VLA09_00305 [Longimicrobiales bacterium]|nr:hypothetical protein [Longimicrobiales bacterium]
MAHPAASPTKQPPVPPPPPDAENPAIIDAEKTFKVTLISALLFCLAAAFIILRTRLG